MLRINQSIEKNENKKQLPTQVIFNFLGNTEFSQDKNSFILSFLLYTLYIRNIFEIKIFNKAIIVYIYKNLLTMH